MLLSSERVMESEFEEPTAPDSQVNAFPINTGVSQSPDWRSPVCLRLSWTLSTRVDW